MPYIYVTVGVMDRVRENADLLGMTQTSLVGLATESFAQLPPIARHEILQNRARKKSSRKVGPPPRRKAGKSGK